MPQFVEAAYGPPIFGRLGQISAAYDDKALVAGIQ